MTKTKPTRINQTQDSISKQGAVDRATEIALNPVWRAATDKEKQQILGDISLMVSIFTSRKICYQHQRTIKCYII